MDHYVALDPKNCKTRSSLLGFLHVRTFEQPQEGTPGRRTWIHELNSDTLSPDNYQVYKPNV